MPQAVISKENFMIHLMIQLMITFDDKVDDTFSMIRFRSIKYSYTLRRIIICHRPSSQKQSWVILLLHALHYDVLLLLALHYDSKLV